MTSSPSEKHAGSRIKPIDVEAMLGDVVSDSVQKQALHVAAMQKALELGVTTAWINAVTTNIDFFFNFLRTYVENRLDKDDDEENKDEENLAADDADKIFNDALEAIDIFGYVNAKSMQRKLQMNHIVFTETERALQALIESEYGNSIESFLNFLRTTNNFETNASIARIRKSISLRIPMPTVFAKCLRAGIAQAKDAQQAKDAKNAKD